MKNFISKNCLSLRVLALLLCAVSVAGCVPYERARITEPARFELLQQGRLSDFEQRLASENQVELDDDWTRVGEAWVALANCQPIDAAALAHPDADPLAALMHASLLLEESRRDRLIAHRGTRFVSTSLSGTILASLSDPKTFTRAASPSPDAQVQWPAAEEAWADELPAALTQDSQCATHFRELVTQARAERQRYEAEQRKWRAARAQRDIDRVESPPPRTRLQLSAPQLALWHARRQLQLDELQDAEKEGELVDGEARVEGGVDGGLDAAPLAQARPIPAPVKDPTRELPPEGTLAMRELEELLRAERVLALGEALPEALRTLPSIDALLWRVRYHMVFFAGEHVRQLATITRPSSREIELQNAWLALRRQWSEPLAARERVAPPDSDQILANWRIAPLLDDALLAEQERRWQDALADYERIQQIGVEQKNYWQANYLHLRLLARLGLWEQMTPFIDQLPPENSPLYAPYVWHVSRALWATGQTERFLAIAMVAMRDRPYQSDPFVRALYLRVLAALSDVPFEARTVELIEDLGPRSKTFERVEAYAAVSLDRGRPENAAAAARWLLSKHLNANYHPRYWAILALAAFLEDDLKGFEAALDQVVTRPKQLEEALGIDRRASFFVNADEQLARVFREMLPVMAEWGDGEKAEALRQKWLSVIVTRAQRFVQSSPESLARPALIELYRIASTMLEAGAARAYPERVGELAPAPLVLGTVRVAERDLDPFEPQIQTYHDAVPSLTLVPRDTLPVARWIEWFEPTSRDPSSTQAPAPQGENARDVPAEEVSR